MNIEAKKMLPVGTDSFSKLRQNDFYYVDKTPLIKELLSSWSEVSLFTRPRRFGKTLNMDMLRCFFEIGGDPSLFNGLAIAEEKELCEKHMGKYPVIFISLKSVSGADYEQAKEVLRLLLTKEARRHNYLSQSEKLTEEEKRSYAELTSGQMEDVYITGSLWLLSDLLYKHYGKKVIILIDEYDVPLDKAYHAGYYNEMIVLIRGMLDQALKTNSSLHFAVLTGCLRISKESIFTGLNNVRVNTIADAAFDEYFGFTDDEVRTMLDYYGISERYDVVKEWYDGYRFGNTDVYCPWDVINYCCDLRQAPTSHPKTYWINTSGNDIVRKLIYKTSSASDKRDIETLISGGAVKKKIRLELTYGELDTSAENLWSVLYSTGYLTLRDAPSGEGLDEMTLAIPNREVRMIFKDQIYEWFHDTICKDSSQLSGFCELFPKGDCAGIEERFNSFLSRTISIRDTSVEKSMKENFYHGYLLGLLRYMDEWVISSNAESGDGYCDILIEDENNSIGIIIEVKYAENNRLDEQCEKALAQIEEKNYEQSL
ncbi:MAG: AAA family ATPase, partial [Clostridia bacterium]|nr:AAA family ATPase [Clostridia bacterium]